MTVKENWQFIVKETDQVHTGDGIQEADIAKLQFRQFVRVKYNDGASEFETIRARSGPMVNLHWAAMLKRLYRFYPEKTEKLERS